MEKQEKNEILSRAVRAGKRTYFFDVKATKNDEKYLTITESKRKFNADNGTFFYEKHKLFLYKEDFAKFQNALGAVLNFIETGVVPDDILFDTESNKPSSNIDFEDLEA
ncbi:PUR family DNA/RNA-binding protein [Bacteroidales bacterium OttesenSCG-928-B11]|nr:PUR family DNA/RNA-binding protein [Bacteroidales bacterium OttesenSCG-928-E04]MDL2309088.1 PUR family DNA/RNA-binding protein [Bacteroidales bacterium OttesenSCG-928-C03]MDL2312197.1 PUR family DNA/RNA-binding protein [Bacteroidales bacterium OttesenSCG-928-B11]MDL2326235.1 PUR family DNA/RNA-binding protein [Bacteroidales bacterium OttesenSCG-928-A14]